MEGKLPEIYWYIFWIGLVLISFGSAYLAGRAGHERALKVLDILKMYAEKGAEPPQAMVEQLTRQVIEAGKPGTPPAQDARTALIQAFVGFLFTACVAWGIGAWLESSGGPQWAQIVSKAAMSFFGFGSFGFIVAALLTRSK
jgi:hypothetical protein